MRNLLREDVLVHDTTQHDGHRAAELADEAEGRGRRGHVGDVDVGLERHEGRLEVGADARAADQLEDDDAGPGRVGFEVDEETPSEGHQGHTSHDQLLVPASLLDDDARHRREDRERKDHRKSVHAAQDRSRQKHGLEIQRQEVGAGDEDHGVTEGGREDHQIVRVLEQSVGHDRVFGNLPLDEEEEDDRERSEDE